MNPYDFVNIDWSTPPKRRRPTFHHKSQGVSGWLKGTIKAETPLLIKDPRSGQGIQTFLRNRDNKLIIPGSSLKGAIRALVETIGPGCFLLFDGRYRDKGWEIKYYNKLPDEFKQCRHPNKLCIACRIFGTLIQRRQSATQKEFHYAGNAHFSDAVVTTLVDHEPVYLPPLFKPRPYHDVWYLSDDKENIIGRKFYFHQAPPYYLKNSPERYRQQVEPVGVGTTFSFTLNFSNLNPQDELPLLLYSLILEPRMRHKIGYGKSAGLGSVQIQLTQLKIIDLATRYTKSTENKPLKGQALIDYLKEQTHPYIDSKHSALKDLRRIWGWPPDEPPTGYGYPTREWFNENSQARIADSWDAPKQ